MLPVSSIQDYLSIRREEHHVAMVESARQGHSDDKRCLTQFNYSCIPGEDGLLRGCRTPSNSVGMYIDFDDAVALDLFAGTGSISLELVSRGCSRVVSVEADRDHANFIRQCFKKLGEESDLLIRGDVFRFLKSCHQKFDFIFADPPYALKELPEIPRLILEGDLLNEGGIFVFEHGKNYDFSDHPRFLEHRSYGCVNFSIFR